MRYPENLPHLPPHLYLVLHLLIVVLLLQWPCFFQKRTDNHPQNNTDKIALNKGDWFFVCTLDRRILPSIVQKSYLVSALNYTIASTASRFFLAVGNLNASPCTSSSSSAYREASSLSTCLDFQFILTDRISIVIIVEQLSTGQMFQNIQTPSLSGKSTGNT